MAEEAEGGEVEVVGDGDGDLKVCIVAHTQGT